MFLTFCIRKLWFNILRFGKISYRSSSLTSDKFTYSNNHILEKIWYNSVCMNGAVFFISSLIELIFFTSFYWSWIADQYNVKKVYSFKLMHTWTYVMIIIFLYFPYFFKLNENFMHLISLLFRFLFCWKGGKYV